jgi:hypothetical protein
MVLFLHPLFHEYDDKHGGHYKADTVRVKMYQRTRQSADGGTGYPVKVV